MATRRQERIVNIVIPAWNAAASLPATLDSLAEAGCAIILADAASPDGTAQLAESMGVQVVQAPRGRGAQLATGIAATTAPWLLLLHADTRPEPGWWQATQAFMARGPGVGYFDFTLDSDAPAARRLERAVAWRCRHFALPYGDQGLLIHRDVLERAGGIRPLPLMEDVDLIRRLRPLRPERIGVRAMTSAARFERDGYLRRPARNLVFLAAWLAGVPPRVLARWY